MSHDTVLPLEVIKEVFLNLDDDDKLTQSACSQISTWFRDDHQRRLFSSVDLAYLVVPCLKAHVHILVDVEQPCKALKFLSAIVGRPQLATYVRRLSFSVNYQMHRDSTGTISKSPTGPTSFLDILPRLTHIEQFTWASRSPVNSRYLATPIYTAIRDVLERSKALTRMDLSGLLDVSPTVFQRATGVKHLTLPWRISSYDVYPLDLSPSPSVTLRPTSLAVVSDMPHMTSQHPSHGIIALLLQGENAPLSLSELKTLIIANAGARPAYISALLEFAPKETLANLRLLCPHDTMQPLNPPEDDPFNFATWTTPPPVVSLNSLHGLTHLDLLVAIRALSDGDFRRRDEDIVVTPLAWVSSVLQSLPDVGTNDRPLRLRLLVTVDVPSPDDHISLVPWGILLKALKAKQNRLKEVHIQLTILQHHRRHSPPQRPHDTIAALKRHLSEYSMLGNWVKIQYAICDAQTYKHPLDGHF